MTPFLGPAIIFSSTLIYALLPVLLKKSNQTLPPFTIMTVSMFSLFIISLILAITLENFTQIKVGFHKNTILILLGIGFFNALAFYLAIQGYKYMPLWQQTMFILLTPVLTSFFAFFILGEAISFKLFIGLIITSIGIFIAIR